MREGGIKEEERERKCVREREGQRQRDRDRQRGRKGEMETKKAKARKRERKRMGPFFLNDINFVVSLNKKISKKKFEILEIYFSLSKYD